MLSLKRTIGPLLGLGMMVWLLGRVDFSRLGSSWSHIHYGLILLGILLSQSSFAIRTLRWRYLLSDSRKVSLRKLYSALVVGQAANWVLPFRIGEMAGAYSLSRMEPVRFSTLMASVVADRILDILWLVSALILILLAIPLETVKIPARLFSVQMEISRASLIHSTQILGTLFAGIFAFLVTLYFWQQQAIRLLRMILLPFSAKLAHKVETLCLSFTDGLHVLRNGRNLLGAILATLLIWGIGLIGVYVLLASFPLGVTPTLKLCLLLLVSVAAGLTIPNAPGYVGTFHIAIVLGLILGCPNVDLDLAVSFAIIYHLTQFVPSMLIGLLFMWIDGLSLIPKFSEKQ